MPKGFKGFQRGHLNPSHAPERREEMRLARIGRPLSADTKRKLSKALRKALATQEMRDKWSLAKQGSTKSMETRLKISATQRRGRTKSVRSATKYADSSFSKFIRLKYADASGFVRCFTCDEMHSVMETDCGHYVSRLHKSLRYDERNAHPQCRRCNRFNEGRKDEYALRLIKKYGPDILENLQLEKHRVVHLDIPSLLELAREFKAKAKARMLELQGPSAAGPHPFFRDLPVGELS